MKHKIGGRVKVREDLHVFDFNFSVFLCEEGKQYGQYHWGGDHAGCTGKIRGISQSCHSIEFDDGSADVRTYWTDEMLEPIEKTWETLQVGDIVVNKNGVECKVLEVLKNTCLLSYSNDHDEAEGWHTFKELQKWSYTIQGAPEGGGR